MRNYNLDWIRVIAMFGIIVDHFISNLGCKKLEYCGLQMGGNVTIFFLISALLFGAKWAKDDYRPFSPIQFLKKRILRIFIPLWMTILLVMPFEYALTGNFNPFTIVMNVVGLGWVRPFGIAGHLWYITMLMFLYICFVGISRIRLDKISGIWWMSAFVVMIVAYVVLQGKLTTYSKAGPPLFMFFSVMMFAKGKEVMEWAKRYKFLVLLLAIAFVSGSQYIYQLGWHDTHKAMAIGSFICAGFLSFLALNSWMNVSKPNKMMTWLAGISYEIYLVHVPLLGICIHYFKSTILWAPIWIVVSVISAIVLNKTRI